jgi:hypothetical protein
MSRRHTKKQSHRRRHQSRSQHRRRRTTRKGGCGCNASANSLFKGGALAPLNPAQLGEALEIIKPASTHSGGALAPLNPASTQSDGALTPLNPASTQSGGGGALPPLVFTPLQNNNSVGALTQLTPNTTQMGGGGQSIHFTPMQLGGCNSCKLHGGRRNRRGKLGGAAAANQKGGGFFDNFSVNPIMGFLQSYGTSGAQSIMYGKSLVDPNPTHQNLGYSMGNPRIT